MLLSVEEQDITEGTRHDCEHCAIALATNRQLHPDYYCRVTPMSVNIYGRSLEHHGRVLHQAYLPEEGRKLLVWFDFGGQVEPLTFPLDIPEQFLRGEGPVSGDSDLGEG